MGNVSFCYSALGFDDPRSARGARYADWVTKVDAALIEVFWGSRLQTAETYRSDWDNPQEETDGPLFDLLWFLRATFVHYADDGNIRRLRRLLRERYENNQQAIPAEQFPEELELFPGRTPDERRRQIAPYFVDKFPQLMSDVQEVVRVARARAERGAY